MLRTVRVPVEFEPAFAAAEEVVSRYFRARREDPEHGTIEIFGERYVLVRAASLSVEFFGLVEQLFGPGRERDADLFARNLLFDLAHALGRSDARNFHAKMSLSDPIARLSAGPVHFAHSGWAFVDISPESHATPDHDFYLLFDHPFSFESDAWLGAQQSRDFPVCVMNAGYSSGWCEESFGIPLIASEVLCRAKGDRTCRFVMAPPERIEEHVAKYLRGRPEGAAGETYAVPDFFARKRTEVEVARLYERLKELDTLKTELFANVSHELRTPLMLIAGPVERLLAQGNLTDEQRRDLEVVQRNSRILLKHVNDLLDVARLEAGKTVLGYAEVELSELVRLVSANFDTFARDRGVSYSVSTPERIPAEIDPEKVARVLTNLLSNAFKFARTTVNVSLRPDGANARLEVGDDGRGVPVALRAAIFERFRQAEAGATREYGGTGLGLAIAREFVELHGGNISVATSPQGGALFVVELPTAAPAGIAVARARPLPRGYTDSLPPSAPTTAEAAASTSQLSPTAPLVLVVEDNPDMLRFIASTLSSEYRVEVATDGQRGLERARALAPDLIVTDIMMPQLSGDELVREIRAHDDLASTPIIVLTAKADDELRVRLLGQGAQDYIGKPFAADELLARARNLVAVKRVRDILSAEVATKTSDLERLATDLASKKRELQDALQSMRIARDHAERASRTKTMFLSLVGHELATPLQTMRLNVEALRRRASELLPAQAEKLEKIERSSRRLLEMIQALLEFVRIESGRLEVRREDVSLPELAAAVIEDLGPLARQKGLGIHLRVGEHIPQAHTDGRLFRLVLVNLVGNAIKYTDQGKIDVEVDFAEGAFRVVVSDTGHGIPPEKLATIFEPFTQLEAIQHKHATGVGLGLTLVREIVKAIGGQISVSSRVGQGSVFTFVLARS